MLIGPDTFRNCKIAVIGDVMLDAYLSGEVRRVSPEAPVPVMHVASESAVPGGGANVAANLAGLGVTVRLVGVCGEDDTHRQLAELLRAMGSIDCSTLIRTPGRRTTKKLRVIGARQQIVRVDHEDTDPIEPMIEHALIAAACDAIDGSDLAIISDYGKGVCTDAMLRQVIRHARQVGKPVVIDPKRRDFSVYRGASLLTPNRKELSEATQLACESDEEAATAAASARSQCGADILLTRSEKGMSFFSADGSALHLGTVAQNVFDVSGAGDTVVAVIGGAIAAGMPFAEAMRLANHAAGIVVSKIGTATISLEELQASLATEDAIDVGDGRLCSREEAVALRWSWAQQKLTVGIANGCFDLLHPGHISLIRQAARSCDRLIMALNSDTSVRRLKGPTRPIQDEQSRAEVIGALKGVATVVLFDEDTPLELIEALQPDLLVKGADYAIGDVVGAEIVEARGGRVLLATLKDGHSTTHLLRKERGN